MNEQLIRQNQIELSEQTETTETIETTQMTDTRGQQWDLAEEMSLADQWRQYVQPFVENAVREAEIRGNLPTLFQKYILAGVLLGNRFTYEQTLRQLEEWEKDRQAKI